MWARIQVCFYLLIFKIICVACILFLLELTQIKSRDPNSSSVTYCDHGLCDHWASAGLNFLTCEVGM